MIQNLNKLNNKDILEIDKKNSLWKLNVNNNND